MNVPTVRRAVDLLPSLATTGIGSLPHTQQELALQMALQFDIPYLPQLPIGHPSEWMIASALDGLPGLEFDEEGMCHVDVTAFLARQAEWSRRIEYALHSGNMGDFEPSVQACRAWKPFLWEVEHRKLAWAKVQLAGPCTVRWVAKTSLGTPVSDVPQLDRVIFQLLLAKSLALVKALRRLGTTPLIFLDEPGLYALQAEEPRHWVALQELKMMVLSLQKEGALVGIHSCSNVNWKMLLDVGVDLLSLDVRLSFDALLEDQEAFLKFLSTGASLSLGIIPTDVASAYQVRDLVESVVAALRSVFSSDAEVAKVLSRSVLTPACGLALRTLKDVERIVEQLNEAQAMLKEVTGPSALKT